MAEDSELAPRAAARSPARSVEAGGRPPPPKLGPYRIAVEQRGRRWYAWVHSRGVVGYRDSTRHKAKTREGAIAKAQADADRLAGKGVPKPDVVEYMP